MFHIFEDPGIDLDYIGDIIKLIFLGFLIY